MENGIGKLVITILLWFGLMRFRKDFSVCLEGNFEGNSRQIPPEGRYTGEEGRGGGDEGGLLAGKKGLLI